MKKVLITLLCGIAVLLGINKANATDISGDVWGTLYVTDSPYNVVGELRVPPESTLVIEPGCYFNFQGHYKFIVDESATLLAIGTEIDSIIFTCDTLTNPNRWHGIRFYDANWNSQLSYCRIEWGYANGEGSDRDGGGIYCDASRQTISFNTISRNTAEGSGGGIYIYSHYGSIVNNTISHNYAEFSGGGICCERSSPDIIDNIVNNNYAESNGGGILLSSSSPIVKSNIITNNQGWWGGGICDFGASPPIINNVINNNSAYQGGAIYCSAANPLIRNNTVYSNYALRGPGAIYFIFNIPAIINCIFWDDSSNDGSNELGSSYRVFYSNIEGGFAGEGNINQIPLFMDPANGDFRLQESSPCIDSGAAFFVWGEDTLVNMLPEEYYGSAPDMGAFEFGMTSVHDNGNVLPSKFQLYQNYPNPFNTNTNISFDLARNGCVNLNIYNLLGQKIETLVDKRMVAGQHSINWNALKHSSGIYFYKLTTGDRSLTKRMTLLK